MATVTYLNSATNETYSVAAFDYIRDQKEEITGVANILGISAGAIAGAMAEENTAYGFTDEILDLYAKSGIDPTIAVLTLPAAITGGPITLAVWQAANAAQLATTRTHAEWQAYYNAAKSFSGAPSAADKILNPALIDAGPANFKIFTAIELVVDYANTYPDLGLSGYLNNYSQLVADLMDPDGALTAKLYGLYMKEKAEKFFTDKDINAYGGKWYSLPQTFRDALLITYTNRGEKSMLDAKRKLFDKNGLPYEPQPGPTDSGGMNHLRNAADIGAKLGLSGYGSDVSGVSELGSQALTSGAAGLAARYALKQLRYVAVEGIDYSAKNVNGELDLYDPATDKGAMTEQYVHDRSAMLGWQVLKIITGKELLISPVSPDDWTFTDVAGKEKITVRNLNSSTPTHQVFFGDANANSFSGDANNDYLYGDNGNDILSGNAGNDYIEGGTGNDFVYADCYAVNTGRRCAA